MRNLVTLAVLAATAAILCASPAALSAPAAKIVEIRLQGNRQVTNTAVLSRVRSRVGDEYSAKIVQDDEQRLLKTGRFLNVAATATPTAGGMILTFQLTERPLVAAVLVQGNKAIKTSDLAKELPFGRSDPLNRYMVSQGKEAIESAYRKKGYHFVRVEADANEMAKTRKVIYKITEGPRVAITKIHYRGNRYYKTVELRLKANATAKVWPFTTGVLDSEQIERDVDAIRNLYVEEGFLDCEVGRELSFSADKSKVVLTFIIREGPRYRINQVRFQGNTVFPARELTRRVKMGKGAYFSTLAMTRDVKRIQETYGELGYIEARVVARKVFKEKAGLLDIVFEIVESDKYTIGEVTIRGNDITQDRVIRREFRFYPEQMYNTVAVETSRRRLMETRLFESVVMTPTDGGKGVKNVVVQVKEGRTAEFLVGFGVSSSSGLLGNFSFTQRNFDILNWPKSWGDLFKAGFKGAGQTLRIVAEPGTELMRFRIEWFLPYIADKPYSLGTKAFLFTRGRESFDERRVGAVVSVGHRFKNRWYGELAMRLENVDVDDIESNAPRQVRSVAGDNILLGLKGSLIRDRTDSRYMPSRGDRITFSVEPVVGDHEFVTFLGDYRFYRTVWVDALDRKHIIATRLSAGYVCGDAPLFEKFYGGGNGSVRGFEYRGISPRAAAPSDDPVGGDFMIFAGTEYRFPIVGSEGKGELQGVVFLDSGTVETDLNITSYRASAGVGIRWFIPMFGPVPISLDFAVPLLKDDTDDTQILSFSFGWRF